MIIIYLFHSFLFQYESESDQVFNETFYVFCISVCGQPAVPSNAKVKTTTSSTGQLEATYECDNGYELFGPATTKCDPIKGWEKELPFCGK